MKISEFDYHLPDELIASFPAAERTASRLLCFDNSLNKIQHRQFSDLVDLLNPNDLLVFNNTKVIPARLFGYKSSGGKIEIMVARILDKHQALCMLRSSKPPRPNSEILVNNIRLTVIERQQEFFLLRFPVAILNFLEKHGEIPLPPYIARKPVKEDLQRYQTVYAKYQGAVAAPTAGLHFDELLLKRITEKGVSSAFVTLHVGTGTFQPVRVENIEDHEMHEEYVEVSEEVCTAIKTTKEQGGRVIAVGTTSVRSLETAALHSNPAALKAYQGMTNIFIYPGVEFQSVDAIITNFHLPKSTLLMLVSAFVGLENIMNLYQQAIEKKYRFYSYGDAMFLQSHSM